MKLKTQNLTDGSMKAIPAAAVPAFLALAGLTGDTYLRTFSRVTL